MPERFIDQKVIQERGTVVFARAVDSQTGRGVFIRTFRCASDEERHSLEALMGVLLALRHRHIERVHEVVRDGSSLIVVTDTPEGEPLADVLTGGPLSVDEFETLASQVLGALSAAHQKGAVHGSLSASRILITRITGAAWKVVITGYGVGFGDVENATDVAPYLCVPPEQWEQKPARRRSDVYAIGCVFYHALSGRSPFDGRTLKEVRHKHVKHDLRPLEQAAPQAPAWLCQWVMSLLNPSPDERLESATAALDRFRTAEVSRNVQTRPVPLPGATPGMSAATGFVQVAGSAFFRVPNVMTQTVSVRPIDPLIHTARHAARMAASTQRHQPSVPGKPLPQPGRSPAAPSAEAVKSNQQQWLIIGAVVLLIAGGVAFLMRGGREKAPVKVVAPAPPTAPIKVAANPAGNDLPPVTTSYPAGRQKPVNYSKLVLHAMSEGSVLSARTDAAKKHMPAVANDDVFAWADYAERGRESSLTFPTGQGTTHPKLVTLKPDATFPLARDSRFIRFTGAGTPAAVLAANAKNQTKDFPFGATTPSAVRGLTFAVVFFQEVKGQAQTLFSLNSQHGSAALRLGEKGDLRFTPRKNGIPEAEQHPPLTISADKFNPVEPLLAIGVWRAEPGEVQLRVRSASGYAAQTATSKAPVPKDALGNLLVGRDGLPGPTAANKSTDPKSLRAFSGGIAEILLYSTGLTDSDLKSLEDQLVAHYFPKAK